MATDPEMSPDALERQWQLALPDYRLVERIARTEHAEVWRVEAPGGILKAARFVFGDLIAGGDSCRRAERELRALQRVKSIRHPNVLALDRITVASGHLVVVSELADRTLWDRFCECRGRGLVGIPRGELLQYMAEAAEALDLMNQHFQVQHLGVTSQHLFLVYRHLKVAGFELARVLEGGRATVTGGFSAVFAAPELFEGWVSRFSDQYSLAIVFQEALTGTRPFTGTTTVQLLMQHVNGTPDLGALTADDHAVLGRALAKRPDDRWPSCSDMVNALK